MRRIHKLLFGGISLIAVTTLVAVTAVSCSNNQQPPIASSANFKMGANEYSFVGSSVKSNNAISFGSGADTKDYTQMPSFDTNIPASQEATAFFQVMNNVIPWVQFQTLNFSNIIAAIASSVNAGVTNIPGFENNTELFKLGAGLGTPISDGSSTTRLSPRTIEFKNDMLSSIKSSWSAYEKEDPTTGVDTEPTPTPSPVSTGDIVITFEWWSTNSKNNINWKGANYNPSEYDKNLYFRNWKGGISNFKPQYTLTLKPIHFNLLQNFYKAKNNKFYNSGKVVFKQNYPSAENNAFAFNGNTDANFVETNKIVKFIEKANSVRFGDSPSDNFNKFINENKDNLALWVALLTAA